MAIKTALQLYSLRDDCAVDLLGTIEKVAELGYEGVEFAGFFGHSASAVRAVLDKTGLVAAGTHTGLDAFKDENLAATIDFHREIGAPFAIIPWLPQELRETSAKTEETARLLTEVSAKVRAAGLYTGFHAHDADMRPLDDGRSAWDILGRGTPDDFLMQYDTGNGRHGGADPAQPLLDHPDRGRSVHLKGHPFGKIIGKDEIDWKAIVAALPVAGTEWVVIEHETYEGVTPLESVKQCLDGWNAVLKG